MPNQRFFEKKESLLNDFDTVIDRELSNKPLIADISAPKKNFKPEISTDQSPFLRKNFFLKATLSVGSWYLPLLLILVSFFVFIFYKKTKFTLRDSINKKFLLLFSISVTLGFSYGLIEVSLIESFALSFSSPVLSFATTLAALTLGSFAAGLIRSSLKPRTIVFFAAVLPIYLGIFFIWLPTVFRGLSSQFDTLTKTFLFFLLAFPIALFASLPFPKLLETASRVSTNSPSLTYGGNCVGMAAGLFISVLIHLSLELHGLQWVTLSAVSISFLFLATNRKLFEST